MVGDGRAWFQRQCRPKGSTWLKEWMWVGNGGPPQLARRNAAMEAIRRLPAFETMDKETYCGGWSDAYYVPARAWPAWSSIMKVVGDNNIMNEVGLPLGFQSMAFAGCAGKPCQVDLFPDCWGGCCSTARDPVILEEQLCGHKMDLRSYTIRNALRNLWDRHRVRTNEWLR